MKGKNCFSASVEDPFLLSQEEVKKIGEAIFCLRGGRKIRVHNQKSPKDSEKFFSNLLDVGVLRIATIRATDGSVVVVRTTDIMWIEFSADDPAPTEAHSD